MVILPGEEFATSAGNLPPVPILPASQPFTNVPSDTYWSAMQDAGGSSLTWSVRFGPLKTGSNHVWCVRGPMQEAVY